MDTDPSTSDRILRVASDLFAQRGFHATTTREIAEGVGIRQPGLFHHFSSKDEIMRALQEIDFEASRRAFEAAADLDASPAVALAVALLLDVDRLVGSPYSFASTLQPAVFNDPAFAEGQASYRKAVDIQEDLTRRGVDAGEFVDVDPVLASGAVEWLIDGMLIDADRRGDAVTGEPWVHTVVSFALRALLRDPTDVDIVLAEAQRHVEALAPSDAEG